MGGEKKAGKNPIICLSQGNWTLQCVLIRRNVLCLLRVPCWVLRTQTISRRFCGSCSLLCLPSCLPSSFPWLCWGLQLWMEWGVLVCGAEAVHLQGGTPHPSRGVLGGWKLPPPAGASACPSPAWAAAWPQQSLAAGRAVLATSRATSHPLGSLQQPLLAALALGGAQAMGKLEEMPKQWTLPCLSKEPLVLSGNSPSHLPLWTLLATACMFPGQSSVPEPAVPSGLCLPPMEQAGSWRCTGNWPGFLLHPVAQQSSWVCGFGPATLVTHWCRGAALLSFLLLSATLTGLFPALETRESK